MDVSFLDQVHKIESIKTIEDVWSEFLKLAEQMGFEHVIYIMANNANTKFYVIDNTGLHENNDTDFYDPFLEYCCHNYQTTFTGTEFINDYPYLRKEAIELIKRAKASGFTSGLGIPVRLNGSHRYGGFNLGTSLSREGFLQRFADEIDSVRLICVMIQRHLETLMDLHGILSTTDEKSDSYSFESKVQTLTTREAQVMQEIANGASRKSCADSLSLSENTVSTHLKNIYRKLEVHNKVDAVRAVSQS